MAERVVLIDGNAVIYRAYYAIPAGFANSKGQPTNTIYGFALMFGKLLAGKTPKYAAMVFDPPGPTFRDKQYAEYKAQRPPMPGDMRSQLKWIDKLVEAHNFPILRVAGYEADDTIGTLAKQAVAAGHEVHIISGDKDFCQLVGPTVRMIDTMRDVTYDEELVRKRWGVEPGQFVDLLGLMGDKVDNIPGVPGIGAKGAAKLLEKYGSLDGILENIEELKGRQKANLTEFREQALLSRALATIDCAVPLPKTLADLERQAPDLDAVNAIYRELEFFSLLGTDDQVVSESAAEHTVISTDAALATALASVEGKTVGVLFVHEGEAPMHGDLIGVTFAGSGEASFYVPLSDTTPTSTPDDTTVDTLWSRLKAWLANPDAKKVTHQLRDAGVTALRYGCPLAGVVGDTALTSFLIDPTKNIPHRFDQVAREFLQRPMQPLKSLIGSGRAVKTIASLPTTDVATYFGGFSTALFEMWPILAERLEEAGQAGFLHESAMPLAAVLAQMQVDGIRVDDADLAAMQAEFSARLEIVEAQVYAHAGKTFKIGSTKQLADVLFEDLGLPPSKKTKSGFSTAADVLARLRPQHPIIDLVLRWRSLSKLINTYTSVLRASRKPETGRIHATFQQTTGASGRLISTDPDLQRTPIRSTDGKRIRQAFIPREGWTLISADWSQIELRVLAHYSQDPLLLSAFRDKVDVHRRTAGQIYDVAPDAVTPAQRNVGKTVNFATIYGQGATALGQSLGLKRTEAKSLIERYFERYAGVRTWLDATIAQAHTDGFVHTILGRKRFIPELSSRSFQDRAYGERVAANTPIQGSAADLCKLAMLDIAQKLEGMQARMLLQIHDELLFEAPPDEVDAVVALVRKAMETPHPFSVPLVVDIGTGASWAEAH